MPVRIDRVEAQMDVLPADAGGGGFGGGSGGAAGGAVADQATVERLRPVVLQILREELERIRRQQGG